MFDVYTPAVVFVETVCRRQTLIPLVDSDKAVDKRADNTSVKAKRQDKDQAPDSEKEKETCKKRG